MKPKKLEKGDAIAIIAPGKGIEQEAIDFAVRFIKKQGFNPIVAQNCLGKHHYFSGTIQERAADLQWAIDDDKIKAILCARGGYGCIQLIDRVNWVNFFIQPKWIIGFSDVTVLHQYLNRQCVSSLHATMPLNFKENTPESLISLFNALEGKDNNYKWETNQSNIPGETEGEVVGGNLAVLCGLIGTKQMPDYQNKILFLEEVGEPLYAIDRFFYQLHNSGVLQQLNGLLIGSFSQLKDSTPPYGSSLENIIKSHFKYNNLPIAFDFPAGHCEDNRALIMGEKATLKVKNNSATLTVKNVS